MLPPGSMAKDPPLLFFCLLPLCLQISDHGCLGPEGQGVPLGVIGQPHCPLAFLWWVDGWLTGVQGLHPPILHLPSAPTQRHSSVVCDQGTSARLPLRTCPVQDGHLLDLQRPLVHSVLPNCWEIKVTFATPACCFLPAHFPLACHWNSVHAMAPSLVTPANTGMHSFLLLFFLSS